MKFITVPLSINNINTVSVAQGGADIESINKIKYNAQKLLMGLRIEQ